MELNLLKVSELFCYPIKSCGGISLSTAYICKTGISYDRQWMIVDEKNNFVTQRQIKSMCQIQPSFEGKALLVLTAPGMEKIHILSDGLKKGTELQVKVWESTCEGIDQGPFISEWLTRFLSREVPGTYRLVRMPNKSTRIGTDKASYVTYADGFSFLFLSEASLADLNTRLEIPLGMDRFRPNIVLSGCPPYFEDTMNLCGIGDIKFTGQTLCLRCPITTTNQITAERSKEPLATLATYRKTPEGVVFARNFSHTGKGLIKIGDTVHI